MDDLTQERYPGAREATTEAHRPPPPRPPEPPHSVEHHRRVLLGKDDEPGPGP